MEISNVNQKKITYQRDGGEVGRSHIAQPRCRDIVELKPLLLAPSCFSGIHDLLETILQRTSTTSQIGEVDKNEAFDSGKADRATGQ